MHRDAAPVVVAEALRAHGIPDETAIAYVQRTWHLSVIDATAAVAAARIIAEQPGAPRRS